MESVDRSPAVTLLLKRMESHPEEFVLVFGALASAGSTAQRKWNELITVYKPYMTKEEIAAINSKFNSIQMDEMHKRIMSTLLNEAPEEEHTVVTEPPPWEQKYLQQTVQARSRAESLLQAYGQTPMSDMGISSAVGRVFGWSGK